MVLYHLDHRLGRRRGRHRLGQCARLRRHLDVALRVRFLGGGSGGLGHGGRRHRHRRQTRLHGSGMRFDEVSHELLALARFPADVLQAAVQALEQIRQHRHKLLALLGRALGLHTPHEVVERR